MRGQLSGGPEFRRLKYWVLVGTMGLVLAACGAGSTSSQSSSRGSPSQRPPPTLSEDEAIATRKMAECLENAGFLVTVSPDGRVDIESPDPKVTPREVIATCQEDLEAQGIVPDPDIPPSRTELEERYDFMVGINECMKEHGFPTEQPPSIDVYMEGGGLWHPYFEISEGPPDAGGVSPKPAVDLETLQRECPER